MSEAGIHFCVLYIHIFFFSKNGGRIQLFHNRRLHLFSNRKETVLELLFIAYKRNVNITVIA